MKRVVIACVLAGAPASADPNDVDDRNAAARLFQEGRELDDSGEIAAACDKFEQSYALDPAPGTALNLAVCAEEAKDWRRAWELYDTAANIFMSRSDSRARFARDRADQVLREHPEVEVQPPSDKPLAVVEKPPRKESRTGLKILAGGSLGVAALAGIWWLSSYLTITDYRQGSAIDPLVGPLSVPDNCGDVLFADDPTLSRFNAACSAHERTKWLVPTTIVAAVLGTSLVVYLAVSTPKTVKVAPAVSGQSAGVTARFEW